MTSSLVGLLASLLLGAVAWHSARNDGFYASEVYGMTARSHRRFAYLCLAFAGSFGLAAAWPLLPAVAVWACFLIAAILYGASFARGYADHD